MIKRIYRQEWLWPNGGLAIKPYIFYYNSEPLVPEWLDIHEMEHIKQQQIEGLLLFTIKYTFYFLGGLFKTLSFKQAYLDIPYEKKARQVSWRMQ